MSEIQPQDGDVLAALRELAGLCVSVNGANLTKMLDGDFAPLEHERWLNELCAECGHKRRSHSGYGGFRRYPHCQIIGRKRLTYRQEKAGKDDTLYCKCGIHFENVKAKEAVNA